MKNEKKTVDSIALNLIHRSQTHNSDHKEGFYLLGSKNATDWCFSAFSANMGKKRISIKYVQCHMVCSNWYTLSLRCLIYVYTVIQFC